MHPRPANILMTLAVLGISAMIGLPVATVAQTAAELDSDFEGGLGKWQSGADGCKVSIVSEWRKTGPSNVVALEMSQSKSASLRLPGEYSLADVQSIRFDIMLPKIRSHLHTAVYFIDEDEFWYQTWRRFTGNPGEWATIEVNMDPEAGEFLPVRHARPWGPYPARNIREVGICVFADRPLSCRVLIDSIQFIPKSPRPTPQRIYNFETNGAHIGQYRKFEATFQLSRHYDNPFDPKQIEIWGCFTAPSGKVVRIPGFFYQEYTRRIDRKVERLTPTGAPKWKIRFAPCEPGEYTYQIEVIDSETLRTPSRSFACVPADDPGFLRVCKSDPKYFEFDNDTFFYPIGQNLPASFDVRNAALLGLTVDQFEGAYAYDRFLNGMARGMENFARIWLASWSFGLEWGRNYHKSYRGVGRYNMENAWRFDHVLDRADQLGVYIQLALTTFGHFRSSTFEGDWPYNPYNVVNGGPLQKAEDFWTHEPSQALYQQMVRYVMARWGYSTHIASWEICNEVNLVTDYPKKKPEILEWHKRCAATIKQFDPNGHMVTANYSDISIEDAVLRLPEISYTSTNHYAIQVVERMRNTIFPSKVKYGKPATMAECGYDFKGATADTTKRYLHVCLWSSYMIPFAGSGLSWWWVFIDDRDLYPMFRLLAEYARGEDRRNRDLAMAQGTVLTPDGKAEPDIIADVLQNKESAYVWVYEAKIIRAESDSDFAPEPRTGFSLQVSGLADGAYSVEFWDTWNGGILQQLTQNAEHGILRVPMPEFTSDVALKIKPVGKANAGN